MSRGIFAHGGHPVPACAYAKRHGTGLPVPRKKHINSKWIRRYATAPTVGAIHESPAAQVQVSCSKRAVRERPLRCVVETGVHRSGSEGAFFAGHKALPYDGKI